MQIHKKGVRRLTACLLSLCIIFSNGGITLPALADDEDTGLCAHHPAHTEQCGYKETILETECGHIHDENCGYTELGSESSCSHVHNADCGYQEGVEGSVCSFRCSVCHPEYDPSGDSGISAVASEDDETNTGTAGGQTDLSKSGTTGIADGNATGSGTTNLADGNATGNRDVTKSGTTNLADGNGDVTEGETTEIGDDNGNEDAVENGTNYVAYDNGTAVGAADEENGVEAADTKFTVTFPTGTAFYKEENGTKTEIDLSKKTLSLKIKRYIQGTALDDDDPDAGVFAYTEHKNLIDGHMQWHTGLYEQPASESTNDGQFWRVWLEDADGKEVEVKLPVNGKATVVVEYLCPGGDTTGALKGALGTRRTCVMNMGDPAIGVPADDFVGTESYSLETSYQPEDIGKTEDHYTKITYYLSGDVNGNSAWGNLVALCSMKLSNTYVSFTDMTSVRDGLAALDDVEPDDVDKQGNDSSNENRRVRTFDSVEYLLQATFQTRGATVSATNVVGMLSAELDMDVSKARFDTAALNTNYRVSGVAQWQIVYYNAEGTARYVEDPEGIWQCDANGSKTGTKVTLNDIISGSSTTNGMGETIRAYSSQIVRQELTAYKDVPFEGGTASQAEEFPLYVNVMAAQDGDLIAPSFAISSKGNKDNFTSEQNSNSEYVVSAASSANQYEIKAAAGGEAGRNTDKVVTVTAAPRYNVVIKQASDTAYVGYFNFANGTGSDTKRNDADVRGRLTAYGITVQLFNETNWTTADGAVDATQLAAKGMMGIELPVDRISFDMQLFGYKVSGQDGYAENDLALILWDYQASKTSTQVASGGDTGTWGRNLYWKNADVTRYAKGATVYNQASTKNGVANRQVNEAYNGGTWSLTASGDGVGTDGKTTGNTTGNGSATRYTFTITGFDFDFDNFKTSFPQESAGNAGTPNWLSDGYVGSFSAGHIQLVQRIPETIDADATIYAKVLVADLVKYPDEADDATHFNAFTVNSAGVKTTTTQEAKTSKERDGDTDGMGGTVDDGKQSQVQVYSPGGISKHNSFTSRSGTSISIGFLGTSYWNEPNYDASTYAGSEVYLWGAAQLSRNSDAVISAYNLLQKFDSSKLEIDQSVSGNERLLYVESNNDANWPVENWASVKGTAAGQTNAVRLPEAGTPTFLYAADPLYPDGWNADDAEEMARMNSAGEQDLIYYETLDELESAGYTCIGVLLEVRNAEIPAGCYPGMRIAMKVKTNLGDEEQTSTVNMIACTVNTARVWVKAKSETVDLLAGVTWKNTTANNPQAGSAPEGYKNSLGVDTDGKDLWEKYFGGTDEKTGNVKTTFQEKYGSGTTARYLTCGKNNGTETNRNYNYFPYIKTAYEDGVLKDKSHQGGYQGGMSLLILGYKSSLGLTVTNEATNQTGNGTIFSPNQGQNVPLYTINNITTSLSNLEGTVEGGVTNLVVTTYVKKEEDPLSIMVGGYQVETQDQTTGEKKWVNVSTDPEEPTEVTIRIDGEWVTYKIYAEYAGGRLKFYLSGVPIGETVSPLRFSGQIGKDAANLDEYKVVATIQGDGDNREFTSAGSNANMREITINISVTGGAALSKTVDTKYIDQNGKFTYTVSYENTAAQTMTNKLYMYDLLPYNGDSRQTNYERSKNTGEVSDALTVSEIAGKLESTAGGNLSSSATRVYQYYSTITPSALEPLINFTSEHDGMDADNTEGQDIDQLLRNALIGNDGKGLYYVVKKADFKAADTDGDEKVLGDEAEQLKPADIYIYSSEDNDTVTGVQKYVNYTTSSAFGTVEIADDAYVFWCVRTGESVTADQMKNTAINGQDGKDRLTLYKVFRWLGVIDPTSNTGNHLDTGDSPGGVTNANHLKYATCLYGVVTNMAANSKLSMSITMKTDGNEATNLYGNQAHAWVSGSNRNSKQASEQVHTFVVGREISGIVWEDVDHDGSYNTVGGKAEPLIEGVTCTLLKWNSDKNQYVEVMGDGGPNGRAITVREYDEQKGEYRERPLKETDVVQITTGPDGAYHFSDVAAGDYVVAFSGDALKEYTDGATIYQKNNTNDGNTNDGVANEAASQSGVDSKYAYYIKYGSGSAAGNNVKMYNLSEMVANESSLRNSTQIVERQDLGLIIDRYKLPETGRTGTLPFKAGGILLIFAAAGSRWFYKRKYRPNRR